ncbi:MAG: hypothetical protein DLM54_07440 [Acidimicrobiales bacterium]|nr:MAG: hypothetical protein DLM54_07440 [Acidimicrobiales bacterium]
MAEDAVVINRGRLHVGPYFKRLTSGRRHPRLTGQENVDRGVGLSAVQSVWEAQAQADPLWAVLSEPDKRGRQWDVEAFMATGEEEVAKAMARWSALGGNLPDHDLAVDFGSGVGRLTQPLGRRFDRVVGVDISPTMVALAQRLNQCGQRVDYVLNSQPHLAFLPARSASLVFSHITLQHLPPEAAEGYLREFLRIVKPGGAIVFQLPSHFSEQYLPRDRSDTPVPETARQGQVVVVETPRQVAPDQQFKLQVEVTNRSREAWTQSAQHPLNVGNHWVKPGTGEVLTHDDGRGRLPGRLPATETAKVQLAVRAPVDPGRYEVQVDVVQEAVSWFGIANAGTRVPIDVIEVEEDAGVPQVVSHLPRPAYSSSSVFGDLISDDSFEAPPFAMNAIPRPEVEALLNDHQAILLGTDEWVTEWHSFMYYVQAAT